MLEIRHSLFTEVSLSPLSPSDLAQKYCVDDLPSSVIPSSRLRPILEDVEAGRPVGPLSMAFLEQRRLAALHALASGALDFGAFRSKGLAEQEARLAAERQRAEDEEAKRRARGAEMEAGINAFFTAQKNDPAYRRRQEDKKLKARYGLDFVEPEVYPRLMKLIRRVDAGQRLLAEDVVWLSTQADGCWTPELRKAHHRLEAEASTTEWHRTGDPWAAVTSSSHWRKAEEPEEALAVTEAVLAAASLPSKLRSALFTTRGGAMRDLGRLSEALELGQEAHRLALKDFRPCTLLGAVHMDRGDLSTGKDWYDEAERLGAERNSIDQELRANFAQASREERERLSSFLLSQDEHRFAWTQTSADSRKS
jgi:hypothetical protein